MVQIKCNTREKVILIILALLSVMAAVIKIFTGFDIDEGYAISMPFRLIQGDHLFQNMWEVHQTSSFFPAAFIWLYVKITGVTTGIAVYLRVIASVIHLFISILVRRSVSKELNGKWSFLIFLVYFNLLPKWMMTLDFSMQQIWGLTLVLLLFKKELATKQMSYDFGMGILLALTVLAYPGMIICYPILLVSICILNQDLNIKTRFNKCLILTSGCALMAVSFFIYVLAFMDVPGFLESIPKVFMDGTHQFTVQTKLMLYIRQWLNVSKQLLIFGIPGIIITLVTIKSGLLSRLERYYNKRTSDQSKSEKNKSGKNDSDNEDSDGDNKLSRRITYVLTFTGVTTLITSVLIIVANLTGIKMGPFHFQVRYLMLFICAWILVWIYRQQYKELLWRNILITTVSFVGILIFSNVGPDSSSSYLVTGIIAGIILLCLITQKEKFLNCILWYVCVIFVLSLIFCKGYYVRITEYGPSNILEFRQQVTEGPLKGIYLLPEDYDRVMNDHQVVNEVTQNEESMLFLGTEGILNLSANCKFVSPSTISTPAFNEQWTDYFIMHPENQPSIIILAKNTIDDRDKFFAKNPFGMWISENYDILHMEETSSLCIIKRK